MSIDVDRMVIPEICSSVSLDLTSLGEDQHAKKVVSHIGHQTAYSLNHATKTCEKEVKLVPGE